MAINVPGGCSLGRFAAQDVRGSITVKKSPKFSLQGSACISPQSFEVQYVGALALRVLAAHAAKAFVWVLSARFDLFFNREDWHLELRFTAEAFVAF